MILAGDIGGTHTRLAIFDYRKSRTKPVSMRIYPSRDYDSLDAIVRVFVEEEKMPIDGACFGVAGPVKHGRSETSNLAWVVDSRQLASELGLKSVELLNDLESSVYGIPLVEPKDFVVLNQGVADEGGMAALISAGTGLGEAGLHWEGHYYRPFPSEGGHADFAPRNDLEADLLLYLLKQYDHVSYERVLSGPGLYNIYRFLRDSGRGDEPAWLAGRMGHEDPSSVIAQAALQGASELCVQSLDLFVSIYGAEAGNLALKFLATGGVFVGGGIAPKIIEKLWDSTFMEAFKAKGRLRTLLEAMPVRVILNDQTALLGAARFAAMKMNTI
jgi:glucokinase